MARIQLLNDNVITNKDEDHFDHHVYADLLADIVHEDSGNAQGISIGLFGKWGQGKSSIVELLKKKISIHHGKTVIFNAFQVKGDRSIRRQLILGIIKEVAPKDYEQIVSYTQAYLPYDCFSESEQNTKTKKSNKAFVLSTPTPKWVWGVASVAILLLILTLVFIVLAARGEQPAKDLLPAITTLLVATIPGVIAIAGWVTNTKRKLLYAHPVSESDKLEHPEQFLKLFEQKVGSKFKNGAQLLVVVDDVDRCDSETVVEALSAVLQLKAFCSHNSVNCRFLIPCDEEQVRMALETGMNAAGNSGMYHDYHEESLRKFFDVIVRMDGLVRENLTAYAVQLSAGFDVEEDDVRGLIGAVRPKDPRQVKKLLNALVVSNRLWIARESRQFPTCSDKALRNSRLALLAIRETIPDAYELICQHRNLWKYLTPEFSKEAVEKLGFTSKTTLLKKTATIINRFSDTSERAVRWIVFGQSVNQLNVKNAPDLIENFREGEAVAFAEASQEISSDDDRRQLKNWLLKSEAQQIQSPPELKDAFSCVLLLSESGDDWASIMVAVIERYLNSRYCKDALEGFQEWHLFCRVYAQLNEPTQSRVFSNAIAYIYKKPKPTLNFLFRSYKHFDKEKIELFQTCLQATLKELSSPKIREKMVTGEIASNLSHSTICEAITGSEKSCYGMDPKAAEIIAQGKWKQGDNSDDEEEQSKRALIAIFAGSNAESSEKIIKYLFLNDRAPLNLPVAFSDNPVDSERTAIGVVSDLIANVSDDAVNAG